MATGDVRTHRDGDEECGGLVDGDGGAGAGAGKDEDECGDEFGESGSPCVAVAGLLGSAHDGAAVRHCPCDRDQTVMGARVSLV